MEELKTHDGYIYSSSHKGFTKEEVIKLIEENFPDDNTYEDIAIIQTIKSNNGVFQSLVFGKTLDI